MKELEILLLVAIAVMGILLIILLQKITILKKQTDDIVKEVKSYLECVLEDSNEEFTEEVHKEKFQEKEEQQNRIIQAVLGEFFP
ncbi:MAG: hypothetical protein E7283_08930 [Lachnospiraceae bacterium]|nr:hypothetical protein [Lachnospiraceae bacterium]